MSVDAFSTRYALLESFEFTIRKKSLNQRFPGLGCDPNEGHGVNASSTAQKRRAMLCAGSSLDPDCCCRCCTLLGAAGHGKKKLGTTALGKTHRDNKIERSIHPG